jgi:DNA repair photolyase
VGLLEAGNNVLLVSKPRLEVISYLEGKLSKFKSQILWRFTIGSMKDPTLSFWEPGAPTFNDRYLSLTFLSWRGYKTSISMEPMLDTREDDIVATVEKLQDDVTDAIWLGKMNHVEDRLKANGVWDKPMVPEMANDLLASQEDDRIWALFKRLKHNPKVKWKNSIKQVVGLDLAEETGLDI